MYKLAVVLSAILAVAFAKPGGLAAIPAPAHYTATIQGGPSPLALSAGPVVAAHHAAVAYGAPAAYAAAPAAYASPLGYGAGLGYAAAPLGYTHGPLAYSAPAAYGYAPAAYAAHGPALAYSSPLVSYKPVEQHGYRIAF